MANPFVAEIRIVGFNFAPAGWATCDGQLLPISQNTALFSLLGTTYGGNGQSTFALPNLQGNFPMHSGQGPGLTERFLGEVGGAAEVTLIQTEIPAHSHQLVAGALADAPVAAPSAGAALGHPPTRAYAAAPHVNPTTMADTGISGGNQPHNNLPPYLVMNFIIALQGIFPARG